MLGGVLFKRIPESILPITREAAEGHSLDLS
jgi:hypothetical protein